MPTSIYAVSVPVFIRSLTNMLAWLDKAESHAKAKGFETENYLGLRLSPDMAPLTRQIQIASDSVKGCVARLSGEDAPAWADNETSFDELRARIQKTIEFAKGASKETIDASATRTISLPLPTGPLELSGEIFLTGFAIPNFYFHCTMTYALLRHAGVELGKMDFIGGP